MNCEDVERDLVAYAEGDLNDVRSEVVRAHLETCACCRAEAQSLQRTLEMAGAYRIPPLSKAAELRMLAGVRERERRRRVYRHRLAPAFSAAAAILILTVVGLRYRTGTPPTDGEVERRHVGADRIALLSDDPEMFDAVMERLSSLDVGGAVSPEMQRGDLRASKGTAAPARETDSVPIWGEYQKRYFQGVRVESLLKDLSDEEMDQVLQKIEERLSV
ncbi:MAG: zf-HC2 domain-containing protein [Candidatus Latescibacteria bacterium]|nr:zf-HC2 domain-containing protein [Candidatus Latescibacterota bacterium]